MSSPDSEMLCIYDAKDGCVSTATTVYNNMLQIIELGSLQPYCESLFGGLVAVTLEYIHLVIPPNRWISRSWTFTCFTAVTDAVYVYEWMCTLCHKVHTTVQSGSHFCFNSYVMHDSINRIHPLASLAFWNCLIILLHTYILFLPGLSKIYLQNANSIIDFKLKSNNALLPICK